MPVDKRENDPSADKEIGDSKALLPVLDDFREAHPSLAYSTFLGDAAFDSYDIYAALLGNYGFQRAAIPLNQRNAGPKSAELSEDGIPLCPKDKAPLLFKGSCSCCNQISVISMPNSRRRDAAIPRWTHRVSGLSTTQKPCVTRGAQTISQGTR